MLGAGAATNTREGAGFNGKGQGRVFCEPPMAGASGGAGAARSTVRFIKEKEI